MGQGGPTGANYGAAHARIDLDLSSLTSGAQVARAAGDATAKAIEQSLKVVQNQQKIVIEQAKQATAAVQAQQAQITSMAKAESAERKAAATSEAAVIQQQAKAQTATVIEEERRKTAAFKQELKERDRSQRQSQVNSSSFGQNAAGFVGAAFGGPIGGLVGAAASGNYGIAAGLAVNQAARFTIDAAQIATAYNRQNLAALQLAGSQAKLNSLMEVYDKDTGKIIPKAQEIADVTKLESLGFADNAKQLDTFTRAARGISLAQNEPQSAVNEQLTTAIISQRRQSLRALGLEYDQVKAREAELQKADKSLTDQQAYGQAVMDQAIQKFGGLATSADGAGTGLERLSKAWADYRLAVGQDAKNPINQGAGGIAGWLQAQTDTLNATEQARKTKNYRPVQGIADPTKPATSAEITGGLRAEEADLGQAFRQGIGAFFQRVILNSFLPTAQAQADYANKQKLAEPHAAPFVTAIGGVVQGATPAPSRFSGEGQEDALVSWNTKRVAIERESQAAVAAEARSWGNQRLEAERAYTKASVREAEDWSRQQSRTQEDFQESQSKNAAAFTKSQAREERDLGRSIAQAQADDADKVADIRKDSAKRALDIEKDYADQRAKAARDHSDKLLDAAGALDAKAVYQEQRQYAEQAADAEKAHGKQVKDNKDQLQERLDDEAKSLRKSIDQQRTALSQREADQAEDYDQSNKDAQSQFTKEQTRAVQDRGVRLDRMATDQADQLTAIDNAHTANMAAIAKRTDDENKALQTILTDAGIYVKGFVDTSVDDAITAYDKYYTHMDDLLSGKIKPGDSADKGIPATRSSPAGYATGGWVQRGGMALVHTGEYVMPAPRASAMASSAGNIGYSVVFQPGSIVVNEADDAERTANLVIDKINTAFEQKRRAA